MAGMVPMGAPAGQMPQGMAPQQRAPMPQAPVMQASGGLAGMPIPEEDYAEGGIVAFKEPTPENNYSLVSDESRPFLATVPPGTEFDPDETGDYSNEVTSGDNTGLKALASGNVQETRNLIKGLTRGTTTADEDDAAVDRYMRQIEKFGGPNIYDPANKRLDEREGARGKSKSQGEGLALLAAAGAILEGNTLARGAAKAFPVFAKEMGEVQRADIAEQRSIEAMRFSLADAQRKERMGDIRGAQAARETARKNKADAATFELQKAQALATLDASVSRDANRPVKGAGAGPKWQEQVLQNNVDYFRSKLKPKPGETPEAFDARVRKMASDETATRLKTSFSTGEIGPGKLGAALAPVQAKIDSDVSEALGKFKRSDVAGTAYRAAVRAGNVEEAQRLLDAEETRLRKVAERSQTAVNPTGGASSSATSKTTRIQFDKDGNQIK
jgi:hypothetical protein